MIIAIIGRKTGQNDSAHSNILTMLETFAATVHRQGHTVMFDKETAENFFKDRALAHDTKIESLSDLGIVANVAVVFGGDGTMLFVAKEMSIGIPLLGVNLGRLGFITDVPHDFDYDAVIDMIEDKQKYTIERRNMLDIKDDWTLGESEKSRYLALNEVVISRSTGKVIEFEVYIDFEYAYHARGDGLMISTPTGSTAYAMSAGGPIIHPTARVIEIVPILPQTLSCRPLIINDNSQVRFKLINGEAEVFVDGTKVANMNAKNARDSLIIKKSISAVDFMHPKLDDLTYSYYHTLREKLNWQNLPGTPRVSFPNNSF
jgi:NAD+ kinase